MNECGRERDQLLCDLARACLDATGMFRRSDVHLEVRDDELVLCGSVATWYEKQLAQETLREVSDAVAIRNEIQVSPMPAMAISGMRLGRRTATTRSESVVVES